eukprot:11019723-Alexandrium_andersonii.AAC.1
MWPTKADANRQLPMSSTWRPLRSFTVPVQACIHLQGRSPGARAEARRTANTRRAPHAAGT